MANLTSVIWDVGDKTKEDKYKLPLENVLLNLLVKTPFSNPALESHPD